MRELARELRGPVCPTTPRELVRTVRDQPPGSLTRGQPPGLRAKVAKQHLDRLPHVTRPRKRFNRLRHQPDRPTSVAPSHRQKTAVHRRGTPYGPRVSASRPFRIHRPDHGDNRAAGKSRSASTELVRSGRRQRQRPRGYEIPTSPPQALLGTESTTNVFARPAVGVPKGAGGAPQCLATACSAAIDSPSPGAVGRSRSSLIEPNGLPWPRALHRVPTDPPSPSACSAAMGPNRPGRGGPAGSPAPPRCGRPTAGARSPARTASSSGWSTREW